MFSNRLSRLLIKCTSASQLFDFVYNSCDYNPDWIILILVELEILYSSFTQKQKHSKFQLEIRNFASSQESSSTYERGHTKV